MFLGDLRPTGFAQKYFNINPCTLLIRHRPNTSALAAKMGIKNWSPADNRPHASFSSPFLNRAITAWRSET